MSQNEFYAALLDSLKDQFVYVDNSHIIRYMNKVAIAEHKDGERLIGQSIFRCHSDKSRKVIMKAYEAICEGAEEILISDKKKKRIFMRAVRDKRGGLLGYYERYEYMSDGRGETSKERSTAKASLVVTSAEVMDKQR